MRLANTIEKKVVLSFLFVSLASILALYGILQLSVSAAFDQLEQQDALKNMARVSDTIHGQFERLSMINREYSEWNDTYNFLTGMEDQYLEDTLLPEYLNNIGVSSVLILDNEGNIQWSHFSDPDMNAIDPGEQLLEPLSREHPLVDLPVTSTEIRGFWRVRSGLLMVVAQPVLRTDGTGDSPGSMVFGQYIGDKRLAALSPKSKLHFQQFAFDHGARTFLLNNSLSTQEVFPGVLLLIRLIADQGQAMPWLLLKPKPWRRMAADQPASHQNELAWGTDNYGIYNHLVYQDLFGKFQGVLQITTPRDISMRGMSSLEWTLLSMLAVTTIIGLVFVGIMQGTIIRPIQTIKTHMQRMGESGDLNARLDMNRADEIGTLAMEFDRFAEKLEGAHKQLESKRDQALTQAKAKSEFLATMSHEIRTPMNGVLGMTELLSRTRLDRRQSKFVQNIQSSGDLLLSIINDILDYSQIESGKLKLEESSFNLRELVVEITDVMAVQAYNKGIELTQSFSPEFHEWVIGDANRLRQVLINLIGNAIKFTDQGGVHVKVTVINEPPNRQSVLIEVIDTGVGIRKDQQHRIFEAFVQADNSSARKYGGTGLGLSISNRLIRLMGGSIGFDSVFGQGSRFWFGLHLPSGAAPHSTAEPLSSLSGARMLIIDVDETSRKVLRTQFDAWGLSSDTAQDGLQALEMLHTAAAHNTPYQVVFLDHETLGFDGLEVVRRSREDNELAELSVVILGSASIAEKEHLAGNGHFDYFLSKPVQEASLYQCLVNLITDEHQGQAASEFEGLMKRPRGRILIAEDNPVNQEVVKLLLENMGHTVDIANDGVEAVAMFGKRGYDLILMDCHMPGMDGYQAATLIRQRETENSRGTPHTPIIALTADAHQSSRQECIEAGMDGFLAKPIDTQLLQKMLFKWLPIGIENQDSMTCNANHKADVIPVVRADPDYEPLDQKILEQLCKLQQPGKPSALAMIIESYLATAPDLLDQTVKAAANCDYIALRNSTHSLKSCSATLGALQLSKCAGELERMAREYDLADADTVIVNLQNEFQAVVTALNDELLSARTTRFERTAVGG